MILSTISDPSAMKIDGTRAYNKVNHSYLNKNFITYVRSPQCRNMLKSFNHTLIKSGCLQRISCLPLKGRPDISPSILKLPNICLEVKLKTITNIAAYIYTINVNLINSNGRVLHLLICSPKMPSCFIIRVNNV